MKILFRGATLFLFCLLLAGCGDPKIVKANYDKIKTGMSLQEVEAILGQGDKQSDGDGSNVGGQFGVAVGNVGGGSSASHDYVWESMGKKITITFTNGKVAKKTSTGL